MSFVKLALLVLNVFQRALGIYHDYELREDGKRRAENAQMKKELANVQADAVIDNVPVANVFDELRKHNDNL